MDHKERCELYYGLGQHIRKLREAEGLTQEDMAEMVGISRSSFANVEAGNQSVTAHQIADIAEAFGMTAKELMNGVWK